MTQVPNLVCVFKNFSNTKVFGLIVDTELSKCNLKFKVLLT